MSVEKPMLEKLTPPPATLKEKRAPLFHPLARRFHLILLLMSGFCCTTFMRIHYAITMTCMVNSTAVAEMEEALLSNGGFSNSSFSSIEVDSGGGHCSSIGEDGRHVVVDYGGELVWNYKEQNIIFSGTFWGALMICIPSMFIVQRSSPRLILLTAMITYIVTSAVTPWIAVNYGYFAVFMIRVVMGLGEGVVIPSINTIIANWFPVEERSTALALFTTGNQIAGAVGNPIAAALCASSLKWPAIFYMAAILGSAWSVLWACFSSNQPSECKFMTKREREYLSQRMVTRNKQHRKADVPYVLIFTSVPFLAQLQCHFVINFIMTLLTIYLPAYFKEVLRLGVITNGTFIAIPNIFNFSFKVCWGLLMDKLKGKKVISPTTAVKMSQSIANFGAGAGLIAVALFVDCSLPILGLCMFCAMFASMGAFVSGFYTSLLSLAPRYTATISSISQFAAMVGRLSTPYIVGLVRTTGQPDEWSRLFIFSALLSLLSGLVFAVFGSGDIQPWGREDDHIKSEQEIEERQEERMLTVIERARTDSVCVA